MVAERRDYVALDWVAAEIGDTLIQARAALDAYLNNPGDIIQLRFCLTYIHQVYGTLKMVEFAGAALLAEEMETTAHALLADELQGEARHDALTTLQHALTRLPDYLQQLQQQRVDRPTALLGQINDLRALRGDTLITESAIFSPALTGRDLPGPVMEIADAELVQAAGKLRQMYQMAMLNYLRGHEPRENLNYLAKVCARLAKLAGGQANEPLWKIAIALCEGLLNRSVPLSPAVKVLLAQIEEQIQAIADAGATALRAAPPPSLLKNLLYYIAASTAKSRYIAEVKHNYDLDSALPADERDVDTETLSLVKAALARQLEQLAEDLGSGSATDYSVLLLAELRRAQDTTALLGLNRAQQLLHDVGARLQSHRNDFADQIDALRTLIADLTEAPAPAAPKPLFNDSEEAQEQLDRAFGAVLLESRNGLEQAKEAIIEFVANQWRHQCLEDVPELLASVRGGLQLAGMDRASHVLAACENYVRQDLLGQQIVPPWQLLDTLADAIASIDYYLERRADGSETDAENIIAMAEESVAALAYPVDGRIIERAPLPEPSNVVPFPAPDDGERYDDHAGLVAEGAAETDEETDWNIAEPVAAEDAAVPTLTAEPAYAPEFAPEFAPEPAYTPEPEPEAAPIEPTAAAVLSLDVQATSEPAFAAGEEPDPEIAEIFIEEAREVVDTLDEYLPQWRINPTDAESLTVIRRAFHTLKGSGRMVGATEIGELAWSVENMLNRVIDGTRRMDEARVGIVMDARQLVPGMVNAFEQRLRPQMDAVQIIMDRAGILAREQELPAAAAQPASAEPVAAIAQPEADVEYAAEPEIVEPVMADAEIPTLIPETETESEFAPPEASFEPEATPELETASEPEAFAEPEAPVEPESATDLETAAEPEIGLHAEAPEDFAVRAVFEAGPPLWPEFYASDEALPEPESTASFGAVDDEALHPDFAATADVEAEATAAEIAATSEAETDEESDRVLLEIFTSEASTHIDTLDAFISSIHDHFGSAELDDSLQRALHTLKGSAHMAGVGPIADLVTPVEHLVKDMRGAQLRADADVLALLEATSTLLHRGLAQLDTDPHAPIEGADDWPARVALLYHAKLDHIDDQQPDSGEDEPFSRGRLDLFLGDAIELISAVAADIALWREGALPDDRQATLAGTIAQVADSAEALNISAVTDLGQALQSLLRRHAHAVNPEIDFFDLAALAAERLIDMLDRLAANQEPTSDDSLLALLQEYEPRAVEHPVMAEPPTLEDAVAPEPWFGEAQDDDLAAVFHQHEPAPATPYEPETFEAPSFDVPTFATAETIPALAEESLTAEEIDAAAEVAATADLDRFAAELAEETAFSGDTSDDTAAFDLSAMDIEAVHEDVPGADLEALVAELAEAAAPAADAEPLVSTDLTAEDDFDLLAAELAEQADDQHSAEDAIAEHDFGAFDDIDAETVDLEAAFADTARLQPDSPLPTDAVNEYLDAFIQPVTMQPVTPPLPEPAPVQAGAEDGTTDEEIDAEILEIFLEEAGDLLEALDETLHAWNNERGASAHLDELQRLLHTLKGGARLAGLKNLGNLAHNFETLLINTQHQQRAVDDDLMHQVQSYQDQLVRLVEAVRAGGHSADASTEVAAEDEYAPAAQTDAVPPEAVQPEPTTLADTTAAGSGDELDLSDDDGVIVPFTRSGPAPARTTGEFLATPLGADVEELPDLAASALLRRGTGPQEVVKISAQLLEQLVNLAGETSIARSRSEEQVNEFVFALDEMQITVDRLQEQIRRLDSETEAQVIFRQEQVENIGMEGFDPLEFDRYSLLQQLSRSLLESASDLIDIKNTLAEKSRDMETLLVQQARINTELQEGLMRSRMVPFSRMVPRLRRIVRQIAGELGKQVDFLVDNAEGELDRTVLERIVAPLEHMLRNAVDHGIESPSDRVAHGKSARGTILLSLSREGGEIALRLADDGRGIDLNAVRTKAVDRGLMAPTAALSDHEILQFILESGFSTAKQVTQISGRGVGMDVVASEIKQLGGSLEIDSAWGEGTRFTVRLPFTVSVNRALMVSVGGDIYAIPLNSIEGIVRVSPFELEAYYQPEAPLFEYAGQPYQMRYMGALLRSGERPMLEGQTMPLPVLLVRGTDHSVAVQVDGLMGSREIVVKTLGPQFGMVHGLSGATVLGDGSVVVILDLMAMIRADAMHLFREHALHLDDTAADRSRPLLVMVVDDSVTVRKVTSRFLERQGMEVMLAKDGVDAINLLQESDRVPDVMLLDIEMPRMDGFEVASRVRHSSRWQDMPIIMITSRTGEKHRERAFALGVNKYLGKPYQEMVLLETIYELTGTTAPV